LTPAACPAAAQEDLAMNKILLIEDNELNRDMLSRRLQKRGYEVVMAADGETGVAREFLEMIGMNSAQALICLRIAASQAAPPRSSF
jgi:CheY-like chemotaxis protein